MRMLGNIIAFTFSCIIFLSSISEKLITVNAEDKIGVTFDNQCSQLTDKQVYTLFYKIENNIMQRFGKEYSFENYDVVISEVNCNGKEHVYDVDVYVEMTLTSNPLESEYVVGMKDEIATIQDISKREQAQKQFNNVVSNYMKVYNQPQLSAFLYRVIIPSISDGYIDIDNAKYYHRVDITDKETDLSEMPEFVSNCSTLKKSDGQEFVRNSLESKRQASNVFYNKDAAGNYAYLHATDTPEFSDENQMGSDCANFVSKCIHYGGIPVDQEGEWYPSPSVGSYAGINWMRTGYNHNGGVVPYMVDKNYFKSGSASTVTLGSILYWNTRSHVALVTYTDHNGTIKYSQHSNVTQTSAYIVYDSSLNVSFYIPNV